MSSDVEGGNDPVEDQDDSTEVENETNPVAEAPEYVETHGAATTVDPDAQVDENTDDEQEVVDAEGDLLERTDNGPRPEDGDQPDNDEGAELPQPDEE